MRILRNGVASIFWLALFAAAPSTPQQAKLAERVPDPHGSPRPFRDAKDVPTRTSLYFEIETPEGLKDIPEAVGLSLSAEGRDAVELLRPGRRFGEGASGWLKPKQDLSGARSLAVYIEPGKPLRPSTRYTARVTLGTIEVGRWSFTTESAATVHSLEFPLDLRVEPVLWHGRFFSGVCNVTFSSRAADYGSTYDLMAEARKRHPRAWSYQRDFWTTGTEYRPGGLLPQLLPNIVRERETRRIAAIEPREGALVLRLEDVFGNPQYGIPAGRPISDDYHVGDEILIADGIHDARSKVVAVDEKTRTVTVSAVPTPEGGWKLAYEGTLPTREDPDAPGLFPPGGCYLRKHAPHGTACYYWGRLDKEYDLIHRKYGRRLMVNFADATGDLARDGRSWTTVKDYAQWHEVARTIAGHLIDRYGVEAALGFTWSVFNEPDLGPLFWRASWTELQTFYDYTTDAILRAFEDRGADASKVFIGGLELGGIFGVNLRLREFLAHCSPVAKAEGAAPLNAAFADRRLDGKRSRRVEALCRAHAGKGTPCDFISIHSYNRSELMAAKLTRAKEEALKIDPEYYRTLWVNSHEACPDWMPPPDEAASDAYLGNGYFPSWCADVVHRQLLRAAADPRYAFGETILTVWPPPANFAGLNAVTRVVHADDDGNGQGDREVTIPMPIFHALGLLSDMGDRYWVLPGRTVGGQVVGGFASRDDRGVVRILLNAHDARDTQSRSDTSFDVTLDLDGLIGTGPVRVTEYRFDRDHNSPFRAARALRDRPGSVDPARVLAVTRDLDGDDLAAQRQALKTLSGLDRATRAAALTSVVTLAGRTKDPEVREAATTLIRSAFGPAAYPGAEVDQIQKLSECRPTATEDRSRDADGRLRIKAHVAGNGCNFVVIGPADR
jgi:hypothetical protein